jgi:hypothetical protein
MSLDSLPYMVFLVLIEGAVGGAIVTYAVELRALVTRGFLKMGSASTFVVAALTLWASLAIGGQSVVGGYPIATDLLGATRLALGALCLLTAVYTWTIWTERDGAARALGLASSAAALVSLVLAAAVFRLPAWGYVGVFSSLLLGALSLGTVTLAMVLGHWYLTTPRLSERPLNEMTAAAMVIIVAQAALVLLNVAAPVKIVPDPTRGGLAQDPTFWLRLLVGLAFPLVLAFMAWRSSLIRGMMSATGLLYLATGAVLAGEALARGLQLATARPF